MHEASIHFMRFIKSILPQYFVNKVVLDVGSGDIDGNNRYLFTNCMYIGNDVITAPNVTIVSKTKDLPYQGNYFGTIISTNCFEHDPEYPESFKKIYSMLKRDGLFCFTCSSSGKLEHGTRNCQPECSYGTIGKINEMQDYYQTFNHFDLNEVLDLDKLFSSWNTYFNGNTNELYFVGIKKGCENILIDNYKRYKIINTTDEISKKYKLSQLKVNSIVSDLHTDEIIYGVYFICCINNYIEVVEEQLRVLEKGLLSITKKLIIFISLYNENYQLNELLSRFNKYDNFHIIKTSENTYEKFGLNNYKKYINDTKYILYYFHTKGVSRYNSPYKYILESRRKILNFYTLEKFNLNIKLLQNYDTVGCSLTSWNTKLHYSGNFWWTRSTHLNMLGVVGNEYLDPEMYILSKKCTYISLSNKTNFITIDKYVFRSDEEILNNLSTNILICNF